MHPSTLSPRLRLPLLAMLLLAAGLAAATDMRPRIVGGTDAGADDFPWIVALVEANSRNNYDGQFCGGSLIAAQWVVTAAHCVKGTRPQEVVVLSGITRLADNRNGRHTVDAVIVHPGYSPRGNMPNDIALLHLAQPLPPPYAVRGTPDLLATMGSGDTLRAAGWGATNPAGSTYPRDLQKTALPYLAYPDCRLVERGLRTDQLCARDDSGTRDTCFGDSGGPLTRNGFLVGLTSYGPSPCTDKVEPGVYTSVAAFADWIDAAMTLPDLRLQVDGELRQGETTTVQVRVENLSTAVAASGVVVCVDAPSSPLPVLQGSCSSRVAIGELAPGASRTAALQVATGPRDSDVAFAVYSSPGDANPADNRVSFSFAAVIPGGGFAPLLLLLLLPLALRRR